jgi:hypothetical protein
VTDSPLTVFVCYELNGVDVPKLCAVKSVGPGLAWLAEDRANRFVVPMGVDVQAYSWPASDLFEWAGVKVEESKGDRQ